MPGTYQLLGTMSTSTLAEQAYEKLGRYALMSEKSNLIGKNVSSAREKKGWSVAKLAREIGVALNTIQSIESGATQKSKYLPDIARVLGVPLTDIDPLQTAPLAEPTIPADKLTVGRDLPVYGTTEAGEGVMVLTSEPVDRAERPPSVANVKDAYGVIVYGDSVAPAARSGDVVVVHPHLPPRLGDLCVFRGDDHGEFHSLLKEFVANVGDSWRVKRYQPDEKTFTIKKKDWPECHVVVTIHRR